MLTVAESPGLTTYYGSWYDSATSQSFYRAQGHVIYASARPIWAAISVTYFTGGRTSVDGITRNDLQRNWRGGFTLSLPLDRRHSIKVFGNTGVSTCTGTDYDSLGMAWQYRWGRGF